MDRPTRPRLHSSSFHPSVLFLFHPFPFRPPRGLVRSLLHHPDNGHKRSTRHPTILDCKFHVRMPCLSSFDASLPQEVLEQELRPCLLIWRLLTIELSPSFLPGPPSLRPEAGKKICNSSDLTGSKVIQCKRQGKELLLVPRSSIELRSHHDLEVALDSCCRVHRCFCPFLRRIRQAEVRQGEAYTWPTSSLRIEPGFRSAFL